MRKLQFMILVFFRLIICFSLWNQWTLNILRKSIVLQFLFNHRKQLLTVEIRNLACKLQIKKRKVLLDNLKFKQLFGVQNASDVSPCILYSRECKGTFIKHQNRYWRRIKLSRRPATTGLISACKFLEDTFENVVSIFLKKIYLFPKYMYLYFLRKTLNSGEKRLFYEMKSFDKHSTVNFCQFTDFKKFDVLFYKKTHRFFWCSPFYVCFEKSHFSAEF